VLELVLGYNGLGRLTGDEVGSVVPGRMGAGGGNWGPTGLARLFTGSYAGDASWLLPAALVLLVALLWWTRRTPRTDRVRAATLAWGGWLVVTAAVFSLMAGIFHSYYQVVLARSARWWESGPWSSGGAGPRSPHGRCSPWCSPAPRRGRSCS
jgi:4-amino-4-deoxy-L-arabinose transferase-like glycosyltransferase